MVKYLHIVLATEIAEEDATLADEHADEDKKNRALVEARNQADSIAYSTEKLLKENEEKVPEVDKNSIKEAIVEVRKVLEDIDATVEQINEAKDKLETASHKMAEVIYKQAAEPGEASDAAAPDNGDGEPDGGASADGEVVDAEFEEVDKDKK